MDVWWSWWLWRVFSVVHNNGCTQKCDVFIIWLYIKLWFVLYTKQQIHKLNKWVLFQKVYSYLMDFVFKENTFNSILTVCVFLFRIKLLIVIFLNAWQSFFCFEDFFQNNVAKCFLFWKFNCIYPLLYISSIFMLFN